MLWRGCDVQHQVGYNLFRIALAYYSQGAR
jgi:hypothetical protein